MGESGVRRLLRARAASAAVSWGGIAIVVPAILRSVADGRVARALFGAGLAAVLLVPVDAFGSPRAMPPWPVTPLAAGAFAPGVLLVAGVATVYRRSEPSSRGDPARGSGQYCAFARRSVTGSRHLHRTRKTL